MIEGRLRVKQTTPGNIRYGRIQMKAFTTAVSRIDNYNLHGFSISVKAIRRLYVKLYINIQ